jgi:hypothetical protein
MSKNEISSTDAGNLLSKLMTESIEVVAYFVSPDGSDCKMRGFVIGIGEGVVLIGSEKEKPESFLTVPFSGDFTCVYRETRESPEEDRERLKESYGESALSFVFARGARLSLFFTV